MVYGTFLLVFLDYGDVTYKQALRVWLQFITDAIIDAIMTVINPLFQETISTDR